MGPNYNRHSASSTWHCQNGPRWLRQRVLGGPYKQKQLTPNEMRDQFRLEACYEGHMGCVNCLEWNQKGNLLASGSDDRNVIIWNIFRNASQPEKNLIHTSHEGNIFSVKFIPNQADTLVATCASDCNVLVTDTLSGKTVMSCTDCHQERVKRIAVHPNEPSLIWSAGEDGLVMQFDLREKHRCVNPKAKCTIVDLKAVNPYLAAKCIAVNPVRSEMLAVGANDVYNRLYDRRYLHKDAQHSCVALFASGHLLKTNNRSNRIQSFGTTFLSFSSNGSELLASVHAEQVYLFNVYEPWERYKSFELSLEPLLLDVPVPKNRNSDRKAAKFSSSSRLLWHNLINLKKQQQQHHMDYEQQSSNMLPARYRNLSQRVQDGIRDPSWKPHLELVNEINSALYELKTSPELYRIRAMAFVKRGWRGDYYQALKDCCCSLALDPLNPSTISCLAHVVCRLGDKGAAVGLLEVIDTMQLEFGQDPKLQEAASVLTKFNNSSSRASSTDDPLTAYLFVNDREYNVANFYSNYHRSANNNNDINQDDNNINTNNNNQYLASGEFGLVPDQASAVSNIYAEFQNAVVSSRLRRNRKSSSDLETDSVPTTFDYGKRFCGHCNMTTDIKEASFMGADGAFVVGGSDDGACYIWDKETTNIVKAVQADYHILNCVQPHPSIYLLATSGIESTVKLWSTSGKTCQDVEFIESRCAQNQENISVDPLDAMIAMMYPD